MKNLATGISPEVLQALGWALLHFAWQGTVLAGLFAVANALCRRATTRYTLGVLTLVLMLATAVVLVVVVLVALLGVALVAAFGSALRALGLGDRGSGSGGRFGRSGDESRRVIGTLSWRRRGFVLACGRFGIGWLAHTRSGDRLGACPFIGSVTIGIGFALLLLTAKGARPTAATMGTSTFVHAPVLVCVRASTAQ